MRSVIFGLVASALTVYNPTGDSIFPIILLILALNLMAVFLSFRIGFLHGKKELLAKMVELIEILNEVDERSFRLNSALVDIKPLETLQKEE